MDPRPPDTLGPDPLLGRLTRALAGRYDVVRELGHGGMATVFLATDLRLERSVALKVLAPDVHHLFGADRFQREIRLAARLSHPHIVSVFEAGEADGLLYYSMEYVDGESLATRLRREGPLSVDETVRLAAEIADALAYAHAHDIVHRDIKPANILVAAGHARVADFGIAKAIGTAAPDSLTATGMSVGTAEYMSPEQASGERHVDQRTDVYGLAAVVYEMLAGEPPFTGPNVRAVVARVLADPPRPLRTVRPGVPAHIAAALADGLAKEPADRPASTLALIARLRGEPAPKRLPRWPLLAAGALVATLAVAVAVWRPRPTAPAKPPGTVLVSGGQYLVGGTCEQCLQPETVTVDPFYLDRTEVRAGDYARFVAAGLAPAPWRQPPSPDVPTTGVMADEAGRYCRWVDPAARLPTEIEWEAAARGTTGRRYPWGDAWEGGRANAASVRTGLTPVGSFPLGAAANGALDLAGNAWEWTASPAPAGPGGVVRYVIRGGAYDSPSVAAQATYRAFLPGQVAEPRRLDYFAKTGFRCLRPTG